MNLYIGQTKIVGGWVSFSVMATDIYDAQAFVKSIPDVRGTCVSKALSSSERAALRAHVDHIGRDYLPCWMFIGV